MDDDEKGKFGPREAGSGGRRGRVSSRNVTAMPGRTLLYANIAAVSAAVLLPRDAVDAAPDQPPPRPAPSSFTCLVLSASAVQHHGQAGGGEGRCSAAGSQRDASVLSN
ncbi:hypothetical protein E2C01_030570 [Portunus trituberculatus]|uniref:Uncharacterized protein n=1 Tax=Portunus trituberculatus TaxID=210409 RepID=A0A5B7EV67_PORTR|nr:hypothetical protein [Portunus trituberculatus]